MKLARCKRSRVEPRRARCRVRWFRDCGRRLSFHSPAALLQLSRSSSVRLPLPRFRGPPLRSRTVGFPESGSDLGFPPQAFPLAARLKCWLTYTPSAVGLLAGSSLLRGPSSPGSVSGHGPGTAKCPEPLCPATALSSPGRCPAPSRRALPLLLRSYGLMRQTKSLSPPSAFRPCGESLQVAASPCWEVALPDVISASLSLDAWICTAVAREVHLTVSSPTTSTFPTGFGGSACHVSPASSDFMREPLFAVRRHFSRSGLQVCLPPKSPPPQRSDSAGRSWRLRPSRTQVVTSMSIGYASRPNRPTDGAGTCTPQDSQPCRPLQPQRG